MKDKRPTFNVKNTVNSFDNINFVPKFEFLENNNSSGSIAQAEIDGGHAQLQATSENQYPAKALYDSLSFAAIDSKADSVENSASSDAPAGALISAAPDLPTTEGGKRALCAAQPALCEYGAGVKAYLARRRPFTARVRRTNASLYVDGSLTGWFGAAYWLTAPALAECDAGCTLAGGAEGADVVVSHLHAPGERREDRVYAVLNMEAHSNNLPTDADNVALMSFHRESEVVVSYGYIVMHSLGVCYGDAGGVRPNGQRCENMRARDSGFYRWCAERYGGDFLTCVFHVVPHVLGSAPAASKGAGALGVTWISASCERHDNYLARLMKHMTIDSMGGCHRTRDEGSHPAMQAKVR